MSRGFFLSLCALFFPELINYLNDPKIIINFRSEMFVHLTVCRRVWSVWGSEVHPDSLAPFYLLKCLFFLGPFSRGELEESLCGPPRLKGKISRIPMPESQASFLHPIFLCFRSRGTQFWGTIFWYFGPC